MALWQLVTGAARRLEENVNLQPYSRLAAFGLGGGTKSWPGVLRSRTVLAGTRAATQAPLLLAGRIA